MITSAALAAHARTLGFDVCGVAAARQFPELAGLATWLAAGHGGEMQYLHRTADVRADITRFLPSARSVIVTGTHYYTGDGSGAIARYAWGDDYHDVLAARLHALLEWLRTTTAEPFEGRIFVDKHPVQERVFAAHAGIGWIGKNTCLIHPQLGSWLLLSGIVISLQIEPDPPAPDQCGACTLCLDACPTGALVDARQLDATKCIAYLTIEHKTAIPEERRAQLAEHVFGCDICQEVCPYNLAPLPSRDAAWGARAGRDIATPRKMWMSTDEQLHEMCDGSALTRVSVSRLRRNLAVALGNQQSDEAARALPAPGQGVQGAAPSVATPLVQEHVAWARHELSSSGVGQSSVSVIAEGSSPR